MSVFPGAKHGWKLCLSLRNNPLRAVAAERRKRRDFSLVDFEARNLGQRKADPGLLIKAICELMGGHVVYIESVGTDFVFGGECSQVNPAKPCASGFTVIDKFYENEALSY